jgi:hypothetical protein
MDFLLLKMPNSAQTIAASPGLARHSSENERRERRSFEERPSRNPVASDHLSKAKATTLGPAFAGTTGSHNPCELFICEYP